MLAAALADLGQPVLVDTRGSPPASPSPALARSSPDRDGRSPPARSPAPGRRGSPRCPAARRTDGSRRSRTMSLLIMPVQADSPLPITLVTSFDQRSPHRFLGHHRGSASAHQPADLLDAVGDAAMHLAGAEHRVLRPALACGAAHMPGLAQIDGDGAGDAADRFAPADHAGDRLLVHAVLQRDDEAVGRQVLRDQRRRPFGVVRLHADEGDVDRLFLRQLLRVGQCIARTFTVNSGTSRMWLIFNPSRASSQHAQARGR